MSDQSHEFSIPGDTPFKDVLALLQIAIFSVEGLFGSAAIRMGVVYDCNEPNRKITIGTGTVVGDGVAKVFTSLLIREIGEHGFSVRRINELGDEWPPLEGAGAT